MRIVIVYLFICAAFHSYCFSQQEAKSPVSFRVSDGMDGFARALNLSLMQKDSLVVIEKILYARITALRRSGISSRLRTEQIKEVLEKRKKMIQDLLTREQFDKYLQLQAGMAEEAKELRRVKESNRDKSKKVP